MSDLDRIHEALRKTARRRRWLNGWKGLAQGALAGGSIWFLTLVIFKLAPIPSPSLLVAGVAAGLLALAGLTAGLWRAPSALETARWIDDRRQLKERISTALELSQDARHAGWETLVVSDAARHAGEVVPHELLPFPFPMALRWALLIGILGAGLGLVPAYRTKAYLEKQKESAQVREVGKNLADLTRQTLQKNPALMPPTRESMEKIAELGEHLTHAKLTRSEALRDLTSAAEKLHQESRSLVDHPALKELERAARESRGGSPSPSEMQRQMDALQKSLGNAANDPSKLDDLQQKLEKMRQAAANMPDKDSAAGQAARQQLAQALSQLSKEAKDMGATLPDLDQAIDALKNNQTDLFLKDLQAALTDMEKLQSMAKAMQQLQQQTAKMGKDLAEQLEKGQTQAAQETLQKMIRELQSAQVAPEQMQKLMDEVAKAVDPASEYGKAAQHLKEAVEQMRQDQRQGAAQSLAQAKKELEKIMEQMADAQALQAAMDALDRASMAMATGKTWEQCKSGMCSQCNGAGCAACGWGKKLGWRPGGKPGYGVGTWADETGWTYIPEQQTPVDHSGVKRPDMDSRGHTDRPEDLNANLAPTKVRGQMSPGSSMPSITLKGVHIKGQSTVQYEEAAAAAQADAQSAVNQDKVPRPYLNSVRSYFDDIQK